MTDEDRPRFSALLFWLAKRMKAQGGKPFEITPDLIADWFDVLSDIRIERLEWGAKRLFATERWFPAPVDLRDAAMLAPSSVLPNHRPYNSRQIEEFSEQTREQAKAALKRMQDGLENWQDEPVEVLVKPVTGADLSFKLKSKQILEFCERKKMLRDQARSLGVAA